MERWIEYDWVRQWKVLTMLRMRAGPEVIMSLPFSFLCLCVRWIQDVRYTCTLEESHTGTHRHVWACVEAHGGKPWGQMTAAKLFYKILVLEHLQSALLLQEHFFFLPYLASKSQVVTSHSPHNNSLIMSNKCHFPQTPINNKSC